jgi:hypothetical protein
MIPLGRTRHRWESNIEMDLQEICCDSVGWIDVAENRDKWRALLSMVRKYWVPYNVRNSVISLYKTADLLNIQDEFNGCFEAGKSPMEQRVASFGNCCERHNTHMQDLR